MLFHADHGWAPGENGMWRKFQLTELGTRAPLIISVPWLVQSHGKRSAVITELVDVLPTLSDLAGLPAPLVRPREAPMGGVSLGKFTSNPLLPVSSRHLFRQIGCDYSPCSCGGRRERWERLGVVCLPALPN